MLDSDFFIDKEKFLKEIEEKRKPLSWAAGEMGYTEQRLRQILNYGDKPLLEVHVTAIEKALGKGDWLVRSKNEQKKVR